MMPKEQKLLMHIRGYILPEREIYAQRHLEQQSEGEKIAYWSGYLTAISHIRQSIIEHEKSITNDTEV